MIRWLLLLAMGLLTACQPTPRRLATKPMPVTYQPAELDTIFTFLYQNTYLITDGHDEFRTPVLEAFAAEERKLRHIIVWEYTWQMASDSLLTVWYLPKGDSLQLIGHFEYSTYDLF